MMIALIHSVHTWHDALLLIVLVFAVAPAIIVVILAKRVTLISLTNKEVRFKQK